MGIPVFHAGEIYRNRADDARMHSGDLEDSPHHRSEGLDCQVSNWVPKCKAPGDHRCFRRPLSYAVSQWQVNQLILYRIVVEIQYLFLKYHEVKQNQKKDFPRSNIEFFFSINCNIY